MGFLKAYPQIKHIHVFLPIERLFEIDTFPFINMLFEEGFQVYTAVTDFEQETMRTVRLSEDTVFREDKLGLPVPLSSDEIQDEQVLDIVFVPLLAFDLSGVRIGYGKGYYDRFLARLMPKTLKIGLSYFPPEDRLPFEDHDIRLDACILPDSVSYFNK